MGLVTNQNSHLAVAAGSLRGAGCKENYSNEQPFVKDGCRLFLYRHIPYTRILIPI